MPFPLKDGGEYSIYTSALSLLTQPDVEVKVLAMNTRKNWIDPSNLPTDFVVKTNFESVTVDTRIKPVPLLLNLFTTKSYFVDRFYNADFEAKLIGLLKKETFDIIQLEHLYLCVYLKSIRANFKGKVVLRAQNVEFKVWESYLLGHNRLFEKVYLKIALRRLKKFELEMIHHLDGVINLSDEDRAIYQNIAPNTSFATIPIGLNSCKSIDLESREVKSSAIIVYHLGSMDWRPNLQGVLWFLTEVMPLLIERYPAVKIRLAGKEMPDEIYAFEGSNLTVDGEVENAIEYQKDKAILIVPLLAGSGIRVKIIEAMSLGKSIVSTSIGAQGIQYTNGKNILIADDPKSFAKAIITCIQSPVLRTNLEKNGKSLIRETYSLKEVGKQKIAFYNQLES